MSDAISPLAPKSYAEVPAVGGARLATASAGIKYAGRTDVLLMLFDEGQLTAAALEKTTNSEECAFCGKPGHHHSKCPKRTSTFKMAGVWCSGCGASGHSLRDCKGDKSNVVKLTPNVGSLANATKGEFEDEEFAAFQRSIQGQQNFHGLSK